MRYVRNRLDATKRGGDVVALGFAAIMFCSVGGCSKPRTIEEAKIKYRSFNGEGKIISNILVEQDLTKHLKRPGSAAFSPITETNFTVGESCEWTVSGWVEAENSFGGRSRSSYVGTILFKMNDREPDNPHYSVSTALIN